MTDPASASTPQSPSDRTVLLVSHTRREQAATAGRVVVARLRAAGLTVKVAADEMAPLAGLDVVPVVPAPGAAAGCELAVVLGGDGTLLRAAELCRPTRTPMLGVNLGHVGFLAESEWADLDSTVDRVVGRHYTVEERMTLDVHISVDGRLLARSWALNEVSIEKDARQRMIGILLEVDGRPLSRWACDGIVLATPTGSTAYAFSAGGPVVWPQVEAMLAVPLSAHALFARPLVVAPTSVLAVEILRDRGSAVLWCDGRRSVSLPAGTRVVVRRGAEPVRLARLHLGPFTDRLVAKFQLPVQGWRGGESGEAG